MKRIVKVFVSKKNDLLCWAIFLLVAFTATNFLSPGVPKLGADDRFPLVPVNRLMEYLNVWSHNTRMLGGAIPMRIATIFPSVALLSFLQTLKLPVTAWQQTEYFLLYLIALVGVFYFVFYLTKSRIISIFASIFYITNPLCLNMLMVAREGMYLWVGYPLMMAALVRGFTSKSILKSSIFFALSSLLSSPGVANPPTLVVVFASFLAFFIYFLIFEKVDRKKIFIFGLTCSIFYLLVNLWWLVPVASEFSTAKGDFVGTYDPIIYTREASVYSSILALFRLSKRGDVPPLQSRYYGFHYLFLYDVVTFLPTLLVMLAPFLARKKQKLVTYYTFLVFLAIFLAKGSHSPLGFIYEWLIKHFPGFSMFRSPTDKFTLFLLLGYSFLLGVTLDELIIRVEKLTRKTYVLMAFLLVAAPMVFIFRTGLKIPYEFRYGNYLVFSFLFLTGIVFAAKFLSSMNLRKINKETTFILFYLFYLFLLDKKMFSSPLANLGLLKIAGILSIAILAGLFLRKKESFSSGRIIQYIFLVVVFPFVFTNLVNHLNGTIKLSFPGGEVPEYYYQAKDWIDSQKDEFRLLSLPSNAVVVAYKWPSGGGFGGYDFVQDFLGRPVVDFLAAETSSEPIRFQALKWLGGVSFSKIFPNLNFNKNLVQILRLMNIKYLMVHNDFWWQYYGADDPKKVAGDISAQQGIDFKKTFGLLDFYEIKNTLPQIYGSPTSYLVNGDATALTYLGGSDYLNAYPVLIFSDQQNNSQLNNYYRIGGRLLFENSNISDLALDYLKGKYGIYISYPGNVKKINISYAGDYEIWAKSDKLMEFGICDIFLKKEKSDIPEKTINVNSYQHNLLNQRWVKLREINLEKSNYSLIAPELIVSANLGKVVLVPKTLREKEEEYISDMIKNNKLITNYYFSPKKFLLSSQKQIYETEPHLKRELNFVLSPQNSYLLEENFEARKNYIPKEEIVNIPYYALNFTYSDFTDWKPLPSDVGYKINGYPPLSLSINFKKDSSSSEILTFVKNENLDLEKNPFLAVSYELEDYRIFNVIFRLYLDTNEDGQIDNYIELNKNISENNNNLVFDILDEVKKIFPDKKFFKLLKEEIKVEKNIGVNCTEREGEPFELTINYLNWLRNKPLQLSSQIFGSGSISAGLYKFVDPLKKEDFIGYVFQPNGNYGFQKIEDPNRETNKKNIFVAEEEDGYLIKQDSSVPLIIKQLDSIKEKLSVELIFKQGNNTFSRYLTDLPIKEISQAQFVRNDDNFSLANVGQKQNGIVLNLKGILDGYWSRNNVRLKEIKLSLSDGRVFSYKVFQKVISTVEEVSENNQNSGLMFQDFLNGKQIIYSGSLKDGGIFKRETDLKLADGPMTIESAYQNSSFITDFINIKAVQKSAESPKIGFSRITYSKYSVSVETTSPIWLVFSESYNKGWKAYIEEKPSLLGNIFKGLVTSGALNKRKEENLHFLVNGYANGWYFDKIGTYRVILEYAPQKYFELGVFISLVAIFSFLSMLFILNRRNEKN